MARYTGPKCRLCRREGEKLFLKGVRCGSPMCALVRRQQIPGQHGTSRARKISAYGTQLREKQKVKRLYGVLESTFRKYYFEAAQEKQETGLALLSILETRLDNVLYRLGFFASRAQSRQQIRYGVVRLNGKPVRTPSLRVKVGDALVVDSPLTPSRQADAFESSWLALEDDKTAKVLREPERDDIKDPIEEHLIVEYYSR